MASLTKALRPEDVTSNYILRSHHQPREPLAIQNVTTLPELFQWQAERRCHAPLFSFRNSPEASLTIISYSKAYETSCRLGNSLHSIHRASGIENPVVGIWLERSIDLHLAILATTISGAAWLPFDADAPAARVTACLKDSKACILLCDAAHYDNAVKATENVIGCCLVTFEELSCWTQNTSAAVPELRGPRPHDTAYMIYTSGSTGTPKGELWLTLFFSASRPVRF